jgi:peptidoglycan/LPS O-acetylase OafA/YrhL
MLVLVSHAVGYRLASTASPRVVSDCDAVGRFGVAIFFVISGLVIYRPFIVARRQGRTRDLWAYAVQRLTRIVPAFWLALTFFALFLPAELGSIRPADWGFVQIYNSAALRAWPGLQTSWTLCVEMSFYLAAPAIAYVVSRRDRWEPYLLVALWLLSLAVRHAAPASVAANNTIVGYIGWFALGMALARLSCAESPLNAGLRPAFVWAACVPGFLGVTALLPLSGGSTIVYYVGLGFLGVLVVLPAVTHPGTARLKWLGDRSYGVYLWHFPIFGWLRQFALPVGDYVLLGTATAVLAAHLSYTYLVSSAVNAL